MVSKVLGEWLLQLVLREEVERQLDEWLDQDASGWQPTGKTTPRRGTEASRLLLRTSAFALLVLVPWPGLRIICVAGYFDRRQEGRFQWSIRNQGVPRRSNIWPFLKVTAAYILSA
jgi:hypothetical protein